MNGWGNIAKGKGLRLKTDEDLLEALERHAIEEEPELRAKVFRMAAERVRSRVLSEASARVISRWLLQLADGEIPIPPKAGPKRKDDEQLEIVWICKTNIERGIEPGEVYAAVGEKFGLSAKRVANIHSHWKKLIG
jgi:hypothetical protein